MYQRILVPVDGSDTSNFGLEEAIRLAKLSQGRLRLVHVVDELSFSLAMGTYAGYVGDWLTYLREAGAKVLEDARATVEAAGLQVDTVLHDGLDNTVYDWVAADAKAWPAELIVIGTHGRRGVERAFLGSSAENILRHSLVPVLLVRPPQALRKPKGP